MKSLVWDADPECDHVWGEEQPARHPRQVSQTKWGNNTAIIEGQVAKRGQFCQKCDGWLGSLGLEISPQLYVKHIVDIFREVRRVLRKDGTVWLNIGDSYAGSWGPHKEHHKQPNLHSHMPVYSEGWTPQASPQRYGLKPKDLCLIPQRLAIALQSDGWWVRSIIIWNKKNPMPSPVTDRPTTSHEYILLLTKSGISTYWTHRDHGGTREKPEPDYRWWDNKEDMEVDIEPENWRDETYIPAQPEGEEEIEPMTRYRRDSLWRGHDYFYDQDAIREPHTDKNVVNGQYTGHGVSNPDWQPETQAWDGGGLKMKNREYNPAGRNKRTVWTLATSPFPGAHFAVFPCALVEPMILAGSSPKACRHCGSAWGRVVDKTFVPQQDVSEERGIRRNLDKSNTWNGFPRGSTHTRTKGWRPTCSCEKNDGSGKCIVLDPFAGSGTTGVVAANLGRDYILMDMNADYVLMAEDRIKRETQQLSLSI